MTHICFVTSAKTFIDGVKENYLSKPHSTVLALCLHLLPSITFRTNELCDRLAVEVVLLVLVMAVSAHVKLIAAWCLEK